MGFEHRPVMLEECINALNINPAATYVDATAGGAGHSRAIAERLQGGRLYALDQDPAAIKAASAALSGLPATVVQTNFRQGAKTLADLGVTQVQGVLMDLGVSSHQLDTAERGFSYHADAPLDMRMAQDGITAASIINTADRQEIADILREYGEEPYAWQIAGKIEQARQNAPIQTTGELAQIIASALPPAVRRKSKNPARRSFQAFRIAVNDELGALREGLETLFELLAPGGRMVVLTFHSLEDRIVKRHFNTLCTACTCPPQFPICVCGGVAKGKLIGKNPLLPSGQELEENRRSRSAKMRCIEKL